MPLLTRQEKEQELTEIRDMLNELEFAVEILPPGQWAEETGLLIGFPGVGETDEETEELKEDAHIAVAYLLQLDEESEEQLTKYLMFSFINYDNTGKDTLQMYEIINRMNRQIRMGSFFLEEEPDGRKYAHYRLTVGTSVEYKWDEAVLGEAIIEMSLYYDLMQDVLDQN